MAKDKFNNHKIIIKQMIKLDNLVKNILPKREQRFTPTEDAIIGFFSVLRGIYVAIIELLNKKMATQSKILLRSLITTSLRLMYLDRHPEDRIALILGWFNKFYEEWHYVSEEASRVGLERNLDLIESKLKESKNKLRNYADQKKIRKYKNFPDEKTMSSDVGKRQASLNYKITSQAVHVAVSSYKENIRMVNNIRHFMIYTEDMSDIYGVAIEAMDWFVEGSISIGRIFGWNNIDQLERLGHDGEAILENI